MNHRTLAIFGALVFAAALAAPARAQDAQPAQPGQPAAQPTAPVQAPAQPAQDSSANGSSSNASPANGAVPAQPTKTPPKHVWTNDDMSEVHSDSAISTVGSNKSGASRTRAKAANAPSSKTAQYYHNQITKLEAQIPPIDQKISDLQAAIEGKSVSQARTYGWSKPGDWKQALEDLQKQRDDINSKIAALQDQARHAGVPENQVP
jgi:hypothetical protein